MHRAQLLSISMPLAIGGRNGQDCKRLARGVKISRVVSGHLEWRPAQFGECWKDLIRVAGSAKIRILFPNMTSLRPNERNLNWNQRVVLAPSWVHLRVVTGRKTLIGVELPGNVELVRARLPGRLGFFLAAVHEMVLAQRHGIRIVMSDRSAVSLLAWACRPVGRYQWVLDIWDAPHKELTTRYRAGSGVSAVLRRFASRAKVIGLKGVARRADLLLTSVLPATMSAYGISPSRLRTFGNAIEVPPVGALSPQPRPCSICFVGRRVPPDRGILRLVEAVERLRNAGVSTEVTIAGEVSDDLARDIRARDPAGQVRLLGEIPIERAHRLMSHSRIGVLPYDANPDLSYIFPVKLLEYLAFGCVVVASDLPGIRALVRDNRDGLLVPPGDVDALTSALKRALTQDELACRISTAGRERALIFDSKSKMAELYATVSALI
jgi:glycosyltransferase involved in cell wall biosynthesis